MLYHPDPNKPFEVRCDASGDGLGAVLLQQHGDRLEPVSFCSKLFSKTQQNWHVSEQEIYAVIHAVEKWRPYLIGNHFMVRTDHQNLQELFNRAKNFRAGKLYRWAVRLQEYEFTAKFIPGKNNQMADYMSRDAIISEHTSAPDSKPHSNKPTPILQLYLHHLCTTTTSTKCESPSTNNTLCPANTSDDVIGIEDEDVDVQEMPSPSVTPEPPTTLPTTTPTTTSQHIPHKYPTRYAKRQHQNAAFQQNLNRDLIIIPDPDEHIKFNSPPSNLPINSPSFNTNKTIIKNKYSYQDYNKSLLQPTTSQTPPIHDTYDIKSYTKSIPINHLKYYQSKDSRLYPIIQYLKYNNNYYLQDLPDYEYQYVLSGRYYLNHQQILMYRYGTIRSIVMPSNLKRSVLQWAHDQVHHGGAKMLLKITQSARYWWIGLRKDIKAYLETCHGCQKMKGRKKPSKSEIQTFSKTNPFELVSIDICGPLPETYSGNRHIVSMIDKFSRFCLLVSIQNIKTITVLKAFQRWLNLFGPPKHLLSDNGTQCW